jgi:hypothetical protein
MEADGVVLPNDDATAAAPPPSAAGAAVAAAAPPPSAVGAAPTTAVADAAAQQHHHQDKHLQQHHHHEGFGAPFSLEERDGLQNGIITKLLVAIANASGIAAETCTFASANFQDNETAHIAQIVNDYHALRVESQTAIEHGNALVQTVWRTCFIQDEKIKEMVNTRATAWRTFPAPAPTTPN